MFEEIINMENLLVAWSEFIKEKRARPDVQIFNRRFMSNIFLLHRELLTDTYRHGSYQSFKVNDSKPRDIHKASVRDRLLHHAVYRVLYPYYEKFFIADSFSCRNNKGTHAALNRFHRFFWKVSRNNTRQCWVLKCDVRKFFASINHTALISILRKGIKDENLILLLTKIINSFNSGKQGVGLPLGNLTSQLFANVYMNELDQYIKQELKIKYYIRYADDFAIFSSHKAYLLDLVEPLKEFLGNELKLQLHEDKIAIETVCSGVDFLGWVHFFDHRVLRGTTRRRMLNRIRNNPMPESLNSYLGLLKHGNTKKLENKLLTEYFLAKEDIQQF
ncbi:MAG: reverse transcriptase/maturase family protein [Candidatus Paceibacterota bacterium]|jgi:retron-type reverse transcriptase